MKICFISNLYPPKVMGGAEIYVERVVKKLAENKENKIVVITSKPFSFKSTSEENDNVKIYRIWPPNIYSITTKRKYSPVLKIIWHLIDLWNPLVYFAVKKIIKKEKPDVVNTHNLAGFSFSVFRAVKYFGIKVVHTCHDYYFLCPYAGLVCPFTGWRLCTKSILPCRWYRQIVKKIINNKIDIVLAPSKFVMEAYLKNGFFTEAQQIVLPLGIDETIPSTPTSATTKTSTTFLCIAQLAPHKGVDVLIKAFSLIHNSQLTTNNLQLIIVGEGSERKKLENLAGDNKNIIFLGKMPYEELQKKYLDVDAVIIPSLAPETFSLVMFEAFRVGDPVIASRVGALSEYIRDNENGFLFEPGDVNQLKELLEKVIKEPELIKKMGQNAQKTAQEYSFINHIKKLNQIY